MYVIYVSIVSCKDIAEPQMIFELAEQRGQGGGAFGVNSCWTILQLCGDATLRIL